MRAVNRQSTQPLGGKRSRRNHDVIGMTSAPAGKLVPLAAIPLLREDALRSGTVTVRCEQQETKELLMNGTLMRITAYLVPWLAMERFEGSRDQFDRSYMGEPKVEGGAVVPFIETAAFGTHGSNAVYKALGLHAKSTDLVNTMYLEVYNLVRNFRAKNRSKEITDRTRLDGTLAKAFWTQSRFEHVVPDFDQAVIDGEVALNVVQARMPVHGIAFSASDLPAVTSAGITLRHSDGPDTANVTSGTTNRWTQSASGNANPLFKTKDGANGYPDIFAQLAQDGITVSLAAIEQARKTQWFAKLRQQFEGHDDEWIIDMLMNRLSIPDQHLKQPMLIADQTVEFQQAKRYATDAPNLAESATSGAAEATIRLRVPQINTGGIVMIFAECMPRQLFERQRDPFLFAGNEREAGDLVDFPASLRDELDQQKVDRVLKGEVDTDHASPLETFGYAPMNWKWTSFGPRIGGKFYRPTVNTPTDQERLRLWAIETVNPLLSEDFYLVNNIHQKVFLDTVADPYEFTIGGNAVIEGNTVFGGMLLEATNNYDAVAAKAPTNQIETE